MSIQGPADISPTKGLFVTALLKKFDKLPESDRNLYGYGPLYLGGNAALGGLIANSFFRRALNVTQGHITSSLAVATIPFITTVVLYNATVSNPLLMGDLNCPTCAVTRGALVGIVGGGVYPLILALPVNAGLSSMYKTAPMPEKATDWRFWMNISRPVARKMGFVFVLQAVFGSYLASRHFDIYLQLLKLADTDFEDLED